MLYTRAADPEYHQWRAQTAAFVHGTNDPDEQRAAVLTHVETVVRQLEVEVGVLMALGTGSGSNDGKGAAISTGGDASAVLHRQLSEVVHEAIAMDAMLWQQHPWFYVHYPMSSSGHRFDVAYNAEEMEPVSASFRNGGDDGEVAPVLASAGPAWAAGNSNGSARSSSNSGSLTMYGSSADNISLVVRPALFKAGNSRGEGYDQAEPLERSVVSRTPVARGMWSRLSSGGGRRDRSRSRMRGDMHERQDYVGRS